LFPGVALKMPTAGSAGAAPAGSRRQMADELGAKHGVDPKLIMAVVKAESGGDPSARSPVGAQGLMQLMPGTARELGVDDPYNARDNMEGGTKYLKRLLDMFGGDLKLAIAAYNAGPGNVRKYEGIPPFAETRRYVPKVLGFYADEGGTPA
jgi:soluble lytic murein transglycosylase-like protein